MYKKVLLAYDGSVEGRRALREGAKLAQLCGAEVFLLAVVEVSSIMTPEAGLTIPIELQTEDYKVILNEGCERLRAVGFTPTARLEVGDAGQKIAEVAEEIDLGSALRLGKGEDASGGREKPSILSDAMEAVIGAVYIDGGWEAAEELVMRLLGERIIEGAAGPGGHDYKTRLQEHCARVYDELPRYHHVSEGPDHAKRFVATVSVNGEAVGHGDGRSKKQAEQAAARDAVEALADDSGAATTDDSDVDDTLREIHHG